MGLLGTLRRFDAYGLLFGGFCKDVKHDSKLRTSHAGVYSKGIQVLGLGLHSKQMKPICGWRLFHVRCLFFMGPRLQHDRSMIAASLAVVHLTKAMWVLGWTSKLGSEICSKVKHFFFNGKPMSWTKVKVPTSEESLWLRVHQPCGCFWIHLRFRRAETAGPLFGLRLQRPGRLSTRFLSRGQL